MNQRVIPAFIISITLVPILELMQTIGLITGKPNIALLLLSLCIFVISSYRLLTDYEFENKYFKFVFLLFIAYELSIIIRGWSFSYSVLLENMLSRVTFWPLIIPLFVFIDKKVATFALLIKYIYFIGIFFLLINLVIPTLLLQRSTAETTIGIAISSGFLLLNASYLSNRKVNLSFIVIFISLLSVIYLARRNAIFTLSGFIILSYILNITNKSRSYLFRVFPVIIGILIFIFFSLNGLSTIVTKKLDERMNETNLSRLLDRPELFEMYFFDMRDNMTFGKGMNGDYYFPIEEQQIDDVTFSEEEYRTVIENGYLQLMLTGGIVHIILFVMVLFPAALLGIFRSTNQFTMAAGILIFLWLLDMFIYGLPSLNLHYIFVWICVGICYKSSLRNMTNDQIKVEFQNAGLI